MSLPKGYKRLEYIQSSGTQYIDTGFKPNQNSGVTIDFQLNVASGWQCIFGTRVGNNTRSYSLWHSGSAFGFYYSSVNATFSNLVGTVRHTVVATKNTAVADDASSVSPAYSNFTANYPLFLFAVHSDGQTQSNASMKLYSCQIYDNGTLVRDYIPCQNADGEIGLWDEVNQRFYASATTTDFIAGPEVSKTPNAPSAFQLDSVNATSIVVSWQTVANALGYKLWLNSSLIADTTETTVTVTVEPFTCMVLSLVAYNENGNSPVVTLTHQYAPDNPILWLVTDRTTQDVALGNTKGTYNASDLNRVGYAVSYLADKLASCGVTTTVHPKTDWLTTDIPSEQVLVTYLQNVRTLRTALTLVASVPEVPQDMQFFTHTEANSIEMLLVMLDTHITNMLSNVDTSWAVGSAYTGLYAKEAYR